LQQLATIADQHRKVVHLQGKAALLHHSLTRQDTYAFWRENCDAWWLAEVLASATN
jgi:hypothetical protein